MNVVGRVGSFISQGVYSVATPFHPFGGAVDIIVVEQEDGSYRSTPWYVRFGKFQGVLKGTEKIVGISVNGVEANFHMYLDNSGEAYFVKEVESGSEQNESSSNVHYESDIPKLNPDGNNENDDVFYDDNNDNLNIENYEETYGFKDENSSSEASVESSFNAYHYGSLDEVENIVESSQNPNSEMVLISVDGHVLTAPISGNEENTENVQLNTPQFHLGPGDSSGDGFGSDADGWASGVQYDMDVVPSKIVETCSHPLVEEHNEGKECSDQQEAQCTDDKPEAEASIERNDPSLDRLDTFRSCIDPSDMNADCSSSEKLGSPRMKDKEDESKASPAIPDINTQEVYPREVKVVDEFIDDSSIPPLQGKLISDEEINVTSLGVKEHGVDVVTDASTQIINGNGSVDLQLDLPVLRSCESQPYNNSSSPQQPGICVIPSSEPQASHESPDMEVEVRNNENNNVVIDTTVRGDSDTTPNVEVEVGNNENGNMVTDTTVQGDSSCKSDHSSESDMEEQSQLTEISQLKSAEEENAEVEISESLTCQKNVSNLGFEISVCANLLRAGMGGSSANKAFEDHLVSKEEFEVSGSSLIKNKNLIVRFNGKYFSWDKAVPIVLGMAVYGVDIALDLKDAIPVEHELPKSLSEAHSLSPSTRGWRLWPNPFRRAKSLQITNASPDLEESLDSESISQNQHTEQSFQDSGGGSATINSPRKQFIRTNVPTTGQVASLNLKDGQNMIAFSFSTRVLGKQQVDAHIYLWKWNARIVISDVDGTITKSDVLGQFMPLVGKDWSQSGVARLFCAIKENGYQLLFLSARAIVQAYLTRSFLLNLKQDGKTLPNGPVVISPDGLFPSLYREVIRRAPHEFKIACLEDIKALFPKEYNPFYAGFGNRDTDDLSYRKIGIPKGKIFIINPKGEVAINNRVDVKSYTSLHTLVNDMFPPTSVAEQEDYNSWNYWKMPLPDVDL